jgi:succinyl-CoA synthetase beta subunit
MKIHEYQGKEILRKFGVRVPRGFPAFTVDEAVKAAEQLGGPVWVVKAQIHAGGRGKGGGVKLARSIEEVRKLATEILGMQLVTHQTGPGGQKVRRLLIEEGADIKKELYVAMVTDRVSQRVVAMASSEGGMDVEEVAEHTPEKIHKVTIDPALGMTTEQASELSRKIGVPEASIAQSSSVLQGLYRAFWETDASLAEINPLIVTGSGDVIALDAKWNFDPNALFRHPEIVELRDLNEEDPAEIEASKFDLAYIQLDGNIGCLVNGAGLAMATMDTIKLFGGEPANFLDVGGGATAEKVTEAFKIMLKNPNLKAILVNIFGGIMRCDVIAEGVITACKNVSLSVPLVVRMKGTNEDLGKKMLAESGLPIIAANSMAEAAQKVVAAAEGKPIPADAPAKDLGAKIEAAMGAGAGIAAIATTTAAKPVAAAAAVVGATAVAATALAGNLASKATAGAASATAAGAAVGAAGLAKVAGAAGAVGAGVGAGASTLGAATVATGAAIAGAAAMAPKSGGGLMKWLLLGVGVLVAAFLFKTFGSKSPAPEPVPAKVEMPAVEAAKVETAKVEAPAATAVVPAAPVAAVSSKAVALAVEFDTNSANIRNVSFKNLNEFAKSLAESKAKGEIGGHTDNQGKPEANLKLSQDRAQSVIKYLESKGVAVGQLSAKGYGDTKAKADNATVAGRQENRRVEFVPN